MSYEVSIADMAAKVHTTKSERETFRQCYMLAFVHAPRGTTLSHLSVTSIAISIFAYIVSTTGSPKMLTKVVASIATIEAEATGRKVPEAYLTNSFPFLRWANETALTLLNATNATGEVLN